VHIHKVLELTPETEDLFQGLRRKTVKQCMEEVTAGIKKIKPQIKRFGARHKAYRELCERMATVMGTVCAYSS
jgi:hypothetical protein